MPRTRFSTKTAALFVGLEVPFLGLLVPGLAGLWSVELRAIAVPVLAWLLLTRVIAVVHHALMLRPVDAWRDDGADERALIGAEALLRLAPVRILVVNSLLWVAGYFAASTQLWLSPSTAGLLGPAELGILVLFVVANVGGAGSYGYILLALLTGAERAELSHAIHERGIELPRHRGSLGLRLGLLAATFALTPTMLLGAGARSSDVAFDRYQVAVELEARAMELAAAAADGDGDDHDDHRIVEGSLELGPTHGTRDNLPTLEGTRVELDRRARRMTAAVELSPGRWLMVDSQVNTVESSRSIRLSSLAVLLVIWAGIVSFLVPRSMITPIKAVDGAMRRLVEVGDIRSLEHLPVVQDDEIGELVRSFNAVATTLRKLADTAQEVSKGDLSAHNDQPGDLPDAFRAMLAQLQAMVRQIVITSQRVSTAASEIVATSQAQERVAGDHSNQVARVSQRLAALADAAAQISASATGVLDNARQTLGTTDVMVGRIEELSEHTRGIAELLDTIREIAGRSDILALNGSLEATRAGEAGRGFALVAAEMRRLTERITRTVADVGARLGQIDRSGTTTVAATSQGRALAQNTTDAAGEIFAVVEAQRQSTQEVAETMDAMANSVISASVATTQVRAEAERLREQVVELDRLTGQFSLGAEFSPETPGPGSLKS